MLTSTEPFRNEDKANAAKGNGSLVGCIVRLYICDRIEGQSRNGKSKAKRSFLSFGKFAESFGDAGT